jgi:hypothetical protein
LALVISRSSADMHLLSHRAVHTGCAPALDGLSPKGVVHA